jgi:HD-GYP domain-containing protein (c-di-GMP phosphodiesterase class II)
VATSETLDQYLPVAVETLSATAVADFDLYLRAPGHKPLLFRSRSVALSEADLKRLARSGVKTLLIGYADRGAYEEHLRARAAADGELSLAGKYALVTGTARSVFENAWRAGNPRGLVGAASDFGARLVDALGDERPHLREMFELMLHDYYTFTHSANVATYCIGIAQSLGISDRTDLARIAAGALLHDVGKRRIPRGVLNSTQKLTSAERRQIQHHPQLGFEELSSDPDLTWGQLMMVYQHHERIDGCGYPVGILGDAIDPWAKICAVADVFDALTGDRPYREGIPIDDACDYLERRVQKNFDEEIARCLTSLMQPA